jgi:riboflavin biosynthesis pyrimidine reductase
MNLPLMNFNYGQMKLTCLYKNPKLINYDSVFRSRNYQIVYGMPLVFSRSKSQRPYLYNSVVTTVDGKIAFPDAPEGPFISSKNRYAQQGASTDWWTLNVLRASADAIMFGANTLNSEKDATGHVYDTYLVDDRLYNGMSEFPINIIPSLTGRDIPYDHKEFTCGLIPIIIYTTLEGSEVASKKLPNFTVIDLRNKNASTSVKENLILICGVSNRVDHEAGMRFLYKIGIRRLLVESPTMTHIFIKEKLMDELFINTSGIYLGGQALSIGAHQNSFLTKDFPCTELLTLHMHSPHFLFSRYRLIYD